MENTDRSIWQELKPHIDELRRRLLISLAVLGVTTLASFAVAEWVLQKLTLPIGGLQNLQSIEVTENMGVFMRVSLLTGFIAALPFILYEMLAFIMPALQKNEKRWLFLTIPAITLLFLAGAGFSYFIMLPSALTFLTSFLGVQTTVRLNNYVNFVTGLIFWMGVVFQMPLLVFALARIGLVNARMLLKYWRYAIVVIAVVSAMITPTVDPVNMALLMAPLIVLYLLSVLFAFFARPKSERA